MLLSLLGYSKNFFDVTLCEWATDPVDLEIKPYYKPFNSRYYLVPRINKEKFRKEIKSLLEILVLTTVQQSQYITPIFIIPKKEGTVRLITDYRRLIQQLIRNPYPLPKIGETMQQLEGLQHAIELNLNMGYYTIRISPVSQDTRKIVTEFGNFRYN